MTIFEILKHATSIIKNPGTSNASDFSSPMLDAEVLLSYVMKTPRSNLFANLTNEVPEDIQIKFLDLVERRAKHEPVAYLTGEKEFYGRAFHVSPHTLIPRPTTEDLLELVLNEINKNYSTPQNSYFLDIGTGSGCIAINIAIETQKTVTAIDVDLKALQVAQKNSLRHSVENLVTFEHGFLFPEKIKSILPNKNTFFVIANLPYVPADTFSEVMEDVRFFEPIHALISGNDGLNLIWHLFWRLHLLLPILPKNTHIFLEHDKRQNEQISLISKRLLPNFEVESHQDTSGTPSLTHVFRN